MRTVNDHLRVGIMAWAIKPPAGIVGQFFEKRWVLYGNSGAVIAQGQARQKIGQVRADWKRFCEYTGTPYVKI